MHHAPDLTTFCVLTCCTSPGIGCWVIDGHGVLGSAPLSGHSKFSIWTFNTPYLTTIHVPSDTGTLSPSAIHRESDTTSNPHPFRCSQVVPSAQDVPEPPLSLFGLAARPARAFLAGRSGRLGRASHGHLLGHCSTRGSPCTCAWALRSWRTRARWAKGSRRCWAVWAERRHASDGRIQKQKQIQKRLGGLDTLVQLCRF